MIAALAVGGVTATVLWGVAATTTAPSSTDGDRAITPPWQERRPMYRPDGSRPDGMRPGDAMRRREWWRENGPGAGAAPTTRSISPEEWQDIERFMTTRSPKRWAKFNEMPDDERKQRLGGFVVVRYRAMQELKQNDPAMFDIRLRRLPIEDEIFELGWQLNHEPAN